MGEVADNMIEGICCSWCGVYFVRAHRHPVLCKDCWKSATREERAGPPKATEEEV